MYLPAVVTCFCCSVVTLADAKLKSDGETVCLFSCIASDMAGRESTGMFSKQLSRAQQSRRPQLLNSLYTACIPQAQVYTDTEQTANDTPKPTGKKPFPRSHLVPPISGQGRKGGDTHRIIFSLASPPFSDHPIGGLEKKFVLPLP